MWHRRFRELCGLRHMPAVPFIAAIAGSNPAEGIDVHLLCLLHVEQVGAFGTGWSLNQRSPTVWVLFRNLQKRRHITDMGWNAKEITWHAVAWQQTCVEVCNEMAVSIIRVNPYWLCDVSVCSLHTVSSYCRICDVTDTLMAVITILFLLLLLLLLLLVVVVVVMKQQ